MINTATATFDDFIAPAFDWVANADAWVFGKLESFGESLLNDIHSIYDAAIADLVAGLGELGNLVGGEVMTVVHAVEAAWDWILWFGEHALEDFIDLPGEITSLGHLSSAKQFAADVHGSVDWVESVLENFIGS